jgi:hypothetical protein
VIFEEVVADSFFVGAAAHGTFVRIQIDQMARTLPGPVIREWWVKTSPWPRNAGSRRTRRLPIHTRKSFPSTWPWLPGPPVTEFR